MAYEDDVSISAIDRLYEEAGVILPGMTLKNIKEVQTFHKSVVHNRQMHLSNEVKRYQDLVLNRDQVVQSLATRRAEVMRIIAGAQASEEFGFQYIVTFNSNDLPRSELGDFPIDKYILPVKLTDAEETGGLFGLRF